MLVKQSQNSHNRHERIQAFIKHSEVSQAWSLHACWTRMLYNDRLETIDNSQSTNSTKLNQTLIAKNFLLYCRLIYMLSILCVRLTIKVKVGIPESFKVGWYPPKKTGSSHLKAPDRLLLEKAHQTASVVQGKKRNALTCEDISHSHFTRFFHECWDRKSCFLNQV